MPKEPRRVPTVLGRVQNGPVTRPRGSVVIFVASLQTAGVLCTWRNPPAPVAGGSARKPAASHLCRSAPEPLKWIGRGCTFLLSEQAARRASRLLLTSVAPLRNRLSGLVVVAPFCSQNRWLAAQAGCFSPRVAPLRNRLSGLVVAAPFCSQNRPLGAPAGLAASSKNKLVASLQTVELAVSNQHSAPKHRLAELHSLPSAKQCVEPKGRWLDQLCCRAEC